ncbi:MAG: sterol desaturase family protein [Bacteriovoracaceae bacterium]|nr:sterol desaturase family protein [Bacteriovoracaceae bacterium]
MNPLIFAIPLFVGMMLAENLILSRRGVKAYTFKETLGNLYCGIGQVFIETFFKLPLLGMYLFFSQYSLQLKMPSTFKWIFLFVVVDFLFWLSHLIAHKVKWMWAIHGVHHQSEKYNYSVGLRMPWWHKLTAFWILIPPALLGFSLQDYIIVASLHAAAQIWTHTTLLPNRIPVFERIFVTPSHHRVHHGKNSLYIDKNFGGILSIWDYLFKTYTPETEPVRFGIPKIKPRVNPWSSNMVQFLPKLFPKLTAESQLSLREKITIGSLSVSLILSVMLVFAFETQLSLEIRVLALIVSLVSMISVGIWIDHKDDWFQNVSFYNLISPHFVNLFICLGLVFL